MLKMITDYEKMIKGHANLNVKLQEMSNNADFDMGKLREIIMSQNFDSSVVDSNKNTISTADSLNPCSWQPLPRFKTVRNGTGK